MVRVRAGIVTAVLQFVAGAGGNLARVRSAAGLRAGDLFDPDRMLDIDHLAAALSCAADDLDDAAFGLHLGANFDLESLGLVTYAVLNAATAEIGLNNLVRYLGSLIHGVHPGLTTKRGVCVLRITLDDADPRAWRHLHEAGMLVFVRMMRRLIGEPRWRPLGVSLAHARPAAVSEHAKRFGVAPTFGGRVNEIRFDPAVLSTQVPDADRSLLPVVEQRLQEVLQVDPKDEPWLKELHLQVASRLCDGHPTLPEIAPFVGLSTRTLQRRLTDRGIVYRKVVAQARRRLALQYLEQSDTDLTEIAFLLGYAELSAFAHAFQRWTGTSPGAYRRAHRG